MEMNIIVAIEMSTVPFKTFKFASWLGAVLLVMALDVMFGGGGIRSPGGL